MKPLLLLLALSSSALAQTAEVFHVTKVQDHVNNHGVHTRIFTGTVGNRVFTVEEGETYFAPPHQIEVGQDYGVQKFEDGIGRMIQIREHPDKKGRMRIDYLTIISVEEKSE